jgi:hypothetical protein
MNDLILSVVNLGCSDELIKTAREAGALGSTVINTLGQIHEEAAGILGMLKQDEKEIIFILTSREKKPSIMKAICEAHGLNSKAQGIVFSLPVDSSPGLVLETGDNP